jgi:ribosome-binding protein aMBF1 (putative translation factor)
MKSLNYKQLKGRLLSDPKIKKAYEDLGPEFGIIGMIIRRRIERGLSQKDLAQKIGTKQSAISRLESGSCNPSLSFLQKVGKALNAELRISLTDK